MSQNIAEESVPDSLEAMIQQLPPEKQEELRRKLNRKAWARRFEQVHSIVGDKSSQALDARSGLGLKFSKAICELIDQLEAGDLDQASVQGLRQGWVELLKLIGSIPGDDGEPVTAENLEFVLETSYADLQNQLIKVRQAVAQAIATEKQIENQLNKNKDQASTWVQRAGMAKDQGNEDLAQQALDRSKQYHDAAEALETQLSLQKKSTSSLRAVLNKIEVEVQKAYTKKQLLGARDSAASATLKAKEVMSVFDVTRSDSALEQMERLVIDKEQKAGSIDDIKLEPDGANFNDLFAQAITSIDRLTSVIQSFESRLAKKESDAGLSEPPS